MVFSEFNFDLQPLQLLYQHQVPQLFWHFANNP